MALQKQIIDIPIAGGIESKVYKALVQPGKSLVTQNARLDRVGALAKREAFEAPTTEAGELAPPAILSRAHIVDESDDWRPIPCRITEDKLGLVTSGNDILSSDIAILSGVACIAILRDEGGGNHAQYYYEIDLVDRSTISYKQISASTTQAIAPRVVQDGTRFYVVFSYLTTSVGSYVFTPRNGASASFVQVYNGGALYTIQTNIDIALTPPDWTPPSGHSVNGLIAVFGRDAVATGVDDIFIQQFTPAGTTNCFWGGITPLAAPAFATIVASDTSSNYANSFCVAYQDAGNAECALYNDGGYVATETLGASSAIKASGVYESDGGLGPTYHFFHFVWLTQTAKGGTDFEYNGGYSYAWVQYGGTHGKKPSITTSPLVPLSKGFMVGEELFIWCGYIRQWIDSATGYSPQSTAFLCRIEDDAYPAALRIIGSALRNRSIDGLAFHNNVGLQGFPSVAFDGDGRAVTMLSDREQSSQQASSSGMIYVSGNSCLKAEFGVGMRLLESNGRLYGSGGQVWQFFSESLGIAERQSAVEVGFHLYPECVNITTAAVGGNLSNGTYYLKFIYFNIDRNGDLVLSGTSKTETVTLSGGTATQIITATINMYPGQRRRKVVAYLSTDNVSFYEHPHDTVAESSSNNAATVTLVVTTSAVTSNRLLYTNGGYLDNGYAPCVTDIIDRNKRIYGVTPEGKLVYSKRRVVGEGLAFSPDYINHDCNNDGGSYYQLADMDGNLCVIGCNGVQVVVGEGANDLGAGSTLGDPVILPGAHGITDDFPVVVTDDGAWYISDDGMKLLRRSLEVDGVVGLPVYEHKDLDFTSAVDVKAKHEVRFGSSDGVMLVYDAVSKAWMTFTGLESLAACMWGDEHAIIQSDGTVLVQGSSFEDEDGGYDVVIETPWLRIGSIGGSQRLKWIVVNGEWLSDMTLSVDTYFDFDETVVDQFDYDYESLSVGDPILWRQHVGTRCSAVKIKLTVAKSDGGAAGACCRLFGLSIELAQRPDLLKASASQER